MSPNGSPFERGKQGKRCAHARARGKKGLPLVYVNQFGGRMSWCLTGQFRHGGRWHDCGAWLRLVVDVFVTDWGPAKGFGVCTPRAGCLVPDVLGPDLSGGDAGLARLCKQKRFRVFCWAVGGIDRPFARPWRSMRWGRPCSCRHAAIRTPASRALTMPGFRQCAWYSPDTVPIAPPVEARTFCRVCLSAPSGYYGRKYPTACAARFNGGFKQIWQHGCHHRK
ncbi:MAG: hypothetical protein CM15mP21_1750 [Hyphomicrobiales bacterium]|nr:MAG: hypothetical protein CM15mP21_1750 [Hyphomicrobiales bacterium]